MKKFLIVAAIIVSCAVTVVPRASAQTASFTYTGIPVGALAPNTSFTIGISVVFTSGGALQNINGLSYWMAQLSGPGGFPFMLTTRNIGASLFSDLQTNDFNLALPHIMDPINRHPDLTTTNTDLGALTQAPQPSGTYFLANLTFNTGNAAPGTYSLGNTTAAVPGVGGRISVVNDSDGDTFPIANSPFVIALIPEPNSIALLCVGLMSAGAVAYRRRAAAR